MISRLFITKIVGKIFLIVFGILSATRSLASYNEAIVLTTDRFAYMAGEHICISALITEKNTNIPVNLSRIINFELVSEKKEIVLRQRVWSDPNTGNSIIELPKNLETGHYLLRAYTNFMLNQDTEYQGSILLAIINPDVVTVCYFDSSNIVNPENQSIAIYPNNYSIINDIENSFICEFNSKFQTDLEYEYQLLNSNHDVLLSGKTRRFANIRFKPESNVNYSLKVKLGNGDIKIVQLSRSKAHEFYFQIKDINDKNIEIELAADSALMGSMVNISTNIGNTETFRASCLLTKRPQVIPIPRNAFSNYLTCIRICKDSKCEENTINLHNLPENSSTNLIKNFINRGDTLVFDRPQGMLSYSIVPRYVYEVEKALLKKTHLLSALGNMAVHIVDTSQNCNTNLKIDNRFFPELYGNVIAGRVIQSSTRQPISGVKMSLNKIQNGSDYLSVTSDSSGYFHFIVNSKAGGEYLIYPNSTDENIKIELINEAPPVNMPFLPSPLDINPDLLPFINRMYINSQIANNNSKLNHIKPNDFYPTPDFTLEMKDYVLLPQLEEVFFEIVKSVLVLKQDRKKELRILSSDRNRVIGDNPVIIVDGMVTTDHTAVLTLDPEFVKRIDVVSRKYFYGNIEADGIIVITSVNNDRCGLELPKNSVQQSIPDLIESNLNSYVNTLNTHVWQPLKDNHNTPVSIVFPDLPGEYVLRYFEVLPNGVLKTSEEIYEVVTP